MVASESILLAVVLAAGVLLALLAVAGAAGG